MGEMNHLERVEKLKEVTEIQSIEGNWDQDDYQRGMANGLILALTIMKESLQPGESPPYLFNVGYSDPHLNYLKDIASEDANGLIKAHESYGDSWKKRGGAGAYFVMIRKFDRLDNVMPKFGWDIFKAILEDKRGEGVLDDIRDARRYLLLIEAEARARGILPTHRDNKDG